MSLSFDIYDVELKFKTKLGQFDTHILFFYFEIKKIFTLKKKVKHQGKKYSNRRTFKKKFEFDASLSHYTFSIYFLD